MAETNGRFQIERRISVGSIINLLVMIGGILGYLLTAYAKIQDHIDDVEGIKRELIEVRRALDNRQ